LSDIMCKIEGNANFAYEFLQQITYQN